MSGFDRIKPPERRLLGREESQQPDSRTADPEGRAALFSASGQPTTPGGAALGRKVSKWTTPRARPAHSDTAAAPRAASHTAASQAGTDLPAAPHGAEEGRKPGSQRSVMADGSPTGPDDPRLPQGRSPLFVECGHCGVTCPVPLGHALRQALPLVVLAPWKSHPVFATCPCGERRAWLKPGVSLPR